MYTELQPATDKELNPLYNISILDINSQTSQCLTQNTNRNTIYFWPRFSYDGSRIVFEKSSNEYGNVELFTMSTDGTNIQKLSPATLYQGIYSVEGYLSDVYPSWSPDGTKIAFSSNRHSMLSDPSDLEIFVIDLKTFEVKQLTNAYLQSYSPSWSPDGLQIAFMSNRDGDWEIYIMNADGTNVTQITRNTASDRFPRWSPDGQQLIFHSDRDGNLELYLINTDGTNEVRLTTNPASDATATFSPDGKWIVFHSDRDGDDDIYIQNLETGEIFQLTHNDFSDFTADWGR